ncbi:hypothetical protein B0H19DRAFT_1065828 [Mycena capillaripes]|nr:hypothetical protein B0H19DRAFT_1065828 [Mycena capillaripes]
MAWKPAHCLGPRLSHLACVSQLRFTHTLMLDFVASRLERPLPSTFHLWIHPRSESEGRLDPVVHTRLPKLTAVNKQFVYELGKYFRGGDQYQLFDGFSEINNLTYIAAETAAKTTVKGELNYCAPPFIKHKLKDRSSNPSQHNIIVRRLNAACVETEPPRKAYWREGDDRAIARVQCLRLARGACLPFWFGDNGTITARRMRPLGTEMRDEVSKKKVVRV